LTADALPATPAPLTPPTGTVLAAADRRALCQSMLDAQRRGFLGPGPVDVEVDRSLAFATLSTPPGVALDLGSGGGLPGLVLALFWPKSSWVLLDGSVKRASFLDEAVHRLGLVGRVRVLCERAEIAGTGPLRGSFDLVVARSFGPAAVTAECGAPFLRVGGLMVVTEPPGGAPGRWPEAGIEQLGLARDRAVVEPVALQSLRQIGPCPERYPRRTGVPTKRPLF